jgi:nitroreductase
MVNSFITLPAPPADAPAWLEPGAGRPYPVRPYADKRLAVGQIGELLWAAHKVDDTRRKNNSRRPGWLIFYACCADGIWRYHSREHCLTHHLSRDARRALADAAWNRWFLAQAPCVFVVTTVPKRGRGDNRGEYYPSIEAGRAIERMLLQSALLGLASVPVCEFDDAKVRHDLILSRQEKPLCLIPVGWPDQES